MKDTEEEVRNIRGVQCSAERPRQACDKGSLGPRCNGGGGRWGEEPAQRRTWRMYDSARKAKQKKTAVG